MATSPQKLIVNTANILKYAEANIDAAIAQAQYYPVCVPTDSLPITYEMFTQTLAPKYIAAGWKVVRWSYDANNNRYYIYLSV